MSADQVISLFQFHHNIRHAEDGSIHCSNLTPMLIAAHRKRTAEIDVPQIAKGKRIRRKRTEHISRLAEKNPADRQYAHDWVMVRLADRPRRQRRKQKIASAGFDKTKTKGFDGVVRERKKRRRS